MCNDSFSKKKTPAEARVEIREVSMFQAWNGLSTAISGHISAWCQARLLTVVLRTQMDAALSEMSVEPVLTPYRLPTAPAASI